MEGARLHRGRAGAVSISAALEGAEGEFTPAPICGCGRAHARYRVIMSFHSFHYHLSVRTGL